jgi:hypothetical protein
MVVDGNTFPVSSHTNSCCAKRQDALKSDLNSVTQSTDLAQWLEQALVD